jgi:hypothetical protein
MRLLHANTVSVHPELKYEVASAQHEIHSVTASANRVERGDYSNVVVGDYSARERARTSAAAANHKRYEVRCCSLGSFA